MHFPLDRCHHCRCCTLQEGLLLLLLAGGLGRWGLVNDGQPALLTRRQAGGSGYVRRRCFELRPRVQNWPTDEHRKIPRSRRHMTHPGTIRTVRGLSHLDGFRASLILRSTLPIMPLQRHAIMKWSADCFSATLDLNSGEKAGWLIL